MRWEGGGGDRRQTLRQVCHTTATGKPERFYGNSFCCLSPHGRSPFAGARRDLEPKQERGEPAGVQCGNTEGLEAPPSLRAHRKPPDCQAADSTAAILWRKKKKPVAVQRTAGFPNKTGTQCVYTRFPNVYAPRGGLHVPLSPTLESPQRHSASLCALFFTASARQSAPCSANMARRQRPR